MRITTWTEYSLIISLHLAHRASTEGTRVAARELAESERLPPDYVEQILLRLRRAGLVASVRGARGGYYLAQPASAITVRDIMAASEHETFEVNCERHQVDSERCDPAAGCSIRPVWTALQRQVDEFLGGITLADLMRDEAEVQDLVALTPSP